jgi:hypothetical protein
MKWKEGKKEGRRYLITCGCFPQNTWTPIVGHEIVTDAAATIGK